MHTTTRYTTEHTLTVAYSPTLYNPLYSIPPVISYLLAVVLAGVASIMFITEYAHDLTVAVGSSVNAVIFLYLGYRNG